MARITTLGLYGGPVGAVLAIVTTGAGGAEVTIPSLEYTVDPMRLHYTTTARHRTHYTTEPDRLHYTPKREDMLL